MRSIPDPTLEMSPASIASLHEFSHRSLHAVSNEQTKSRAADKSNQLMADPSAIAELLQLGIAAPATALSDIGGHQNAARRI